jgi:hypothetical protein
MISDNYLIVLCSWVDTHRLKQQLFSKRSGHVAIQYTCKEDQLKSRIIHTDT